jgi:hypothetical protein
MQGFEDSRMRGFDDSRMRGFKDGRMRGIKEQRILEFVAFGSSNSWIPGVEDSRNTRNSRLQSVNIICH